MTRAVVVAVALLAAGCGGTGVSPTTTTREGNAGTSSRCTAGSGGFRACTIFALTSTAFHRIGGGEKSHIERRHGSRWSVLLAPDRAPYPGRGWWRRILADPQGEMLLAEWSGECEVPFTYLITTHAPVLRQVFRSQPVTPLGWTSDGNARVKLGTPIEASKTRSGRPSGIYIVNPSGHVVRLERAVPPARGC
jgi:hypothetical protein